MLKSTGLFGLLALSILALSACAPAPEPVAEEEPPPSPPPPPPTLYEITDVDITAEEPDFTSRNVTVLGFKLGDMTNTTSERLGAIGETVALADEYLTDFQGGAIRVYTFRQTGLARQIEITTRFADEVASPALRTWLENGNLDGMRELMGPEDEVQETDTGATEYVYDSRGIRFIQYPSSGVNAIRFSQYSD